MWGDVLLWRILGAGGFLEAGMSQSRVAVLGGYWPCPFLSLRLCVGRHCLLERHEDEA